MKPKYETPELTEVGKAEEVILGVHIVGDDSDMQDVCLSAEFADESIDE